MSVGWNERSQPMKVYAYAERIALADLRVLERPDPLPGAHDVVLRMRAAALNYRDLAIARGNYHVGVAPPLVPVSDGAGEVIAVGAQVTRFRPGDLACPVYLPDWIDGPVSPRVARRRLGGPSDGVLAEFMCVNEEAAVRAPSHLAPEEAATLPVTAVTAWHALYQNACVRPGETVLVQGAGGVSTAAMQLARAGGARVIALTRGTRHVERLRALGIDDVVTTGDTADWPAQVVSLTGGGVDVAVDVAGGPSLARSIAATRTGGRVHLVGYAADTTATIDIFDAIRHATTIHVATAGSRQSFEALVRVLQMQAIRPVVGKVFPVADVRVALQHLSDGGHTGKVVLTF
ncbi:MAG TPA: NAD(P)-dependent alcohol dehydrogenase [Vineibacter sp.]|nr:NAD(P)-dependent alcohol dehydrogenase [Vineibacter sp.]